MEFNNILDELNNKYETKLILDGVSFFKQENELHIDLLSAEPIDMSPIVIFIEDKLKGYEINVSVNLVTLDEILIYFNKIFPNISAKYQDSEVRIMVHSQSEENFYKTKEPFERFEKKVNKLGIPVNFFIIEQDEEKLAEIQQLQDEKLKMIEEQIKSVKEKTAVPEVEQVIPVEGAYSYGSTKAINDNVVAISELSDDRAKFTVKGRVYELDIRKTPNSNIVTFDLDDGNDAIKCKLFVKDKDIEAFSEKIKKNSSIAVYGSYEYDAYDKGMCFKVLGIEEVELPQKVDLEAEKRIEFNIHSKYSNSESIVDLDELFARLKSFGHKSVGITDLFNVHAYPEIYKAANKSGVKLNLGLQTNLVEDYPSLLVNPYNLEVEGKDFVVFDIETTGLSNHTDKIIEIGAVKVKDGKVIDTFQRFVNPQEPLSEFITNLTGIENHMVANEETIDKVMPEFLEFSKGCVYVAHNAEFDMGFMLAKCKELGVEIDPLYMDTLYISRAINTGLKNHKLDTLAKNYQVSLMNHHRASDDATATAEIFVKMLNQLEEAGVKIDKKINELDTQLEVSNNREWQNLIFARNKAGLKTLYTIVSKSNIDYFYREPRIPYSYIADNKKDLILGTGNYKSKLFNMVSLGLKDKVLFEELNKFDFVGLVPLDFSSHLIRRGYIKDEDHLKEINKKLYELALKSQKLTIAIGDVYYLDQKDYPYRNILKNYPRKRSLENSGAFYLKNTREMLDQFSYFDSEDRRRIVIENTHRLDELIDNFSPIADGTFPPKVKDAEKTLTEESFEVARSIYGDDLPQIVEERLNKELNSIISNGYATLYIIAKMLVKKSNDEGYLVGSRGSVGSSFAATMAEITEVNPLPPHYICGSCRHSEFVHSGEYATGVDLPKKNCPVCGSEMKRDGFDIPFETFLGFDGDKEPDIDLNFASVYQSKIHKYTESLFGKSKVFRAGTLGTIADKTAIGMALKFKELYPEDETIKTDNPNLNRVKRKLVGVKRTTGQHAGGLIIVPEEKDIEDFTPVQYPADKKETGVIITHFDYHAIDKNLLKLDLLGHNSPTIIRLLTDMSGIDAVNIDLSDKDTMDIFSSTDKLNIVEDYSNINRGSLGIPEFGTTFVRGMLDDTKPTTFEELIRISGLSHGTDVWTGNAQELVRSGTADLKSAICTRDDIMNYLIEAGLPALESFIIMEQVRKGKGLKDNQIEMMKANKVPQWYIDSCLKIKYMFPKAHAVAYVMMSYRIAYFKVHHPAYFYAVTFTNEISDFKYGNISHGLGFLTSLINTLKQEPGYADNVFYVYELAEEMFARGIKFADIDLYKSHPTNFEVLDDKTIRPPLMAIDNVSEAIALKIAAAREEGEFISKENFSSRTKTNKTAMESMSQAGLFDNMQETDQIDFFNM